MKIIVSAFSNLYTDQRIEKICESLHCGDYAVELIGNNWNGSYKMERPYPTELILLKTKTLRWAYIEFNFKLYKTLLQKADKQTILYTNDLDSLLPNFLVSKKLGIPLIYDSHEIFTEMPSINGRWTQKVWRILERNIIPKVKYFITASNSYSNWYSERYNIKPPIVVQNFPKKRDFIPIEKNTKKNIILYQGVINPSRGLDKIIPTMKLFPNAELWIVGDGPKKEEYEALTKSLGLEDKVKFLGKILPEKLRNITPIADVGLSIEENNGLSYYYSLPNKISDYIQARIPIVTSNFPEMQRITNHFNIGTTIRNHSEDELFNAISSVLENEKSYYQPQLETAAQELIWEKEEQKLLSLIEKVIRESFQ